MNALCAVSAAAGVDDVLSKSPVAAVGYETSLTDQWRGRQLADAVKLLYSFLPAGATHPDRVKRLTWPLTADCERSLKFFTSVQGWHTGVIKAVGLQG